jgi:Tol biopolymer transport system component
MPSPRRVLLPLLCTLLVVACSSSTTDAGPDPEPAVETGSIQVTVTTDGILIDTDGYTTGFGTTSMAIPVDGMVTFTEVAVGAQSVSLDDLAPNCAVNGSNPQSVTVVANQTATATFSVSCARMLEDVVLIAADRAGTLYLVEETAGEAVRLGPALALNADMEGVGVGVISSMAWLWTTDAWWLGFGGEAICTGCLYQQDPSGYVTFLSDPSSTVRAVAGLAVHPGTGDVYTTEGDASGDLYVFDIATGAVSVALQNIGESSTGKGMTFSNDGLLYVGGSNRIVTVDIDGGVSTNLGAPTLTGFPPTVASSQIRAMATRDADGTMFALSRTSRNGATEIATVDPTTGELTHFATIDESLDGLAFIPSRMLVGYLAGIGSSVGFVSDRSGDNEIYTTTSIGGELVQLTEDPGDDTGPSLSLDQSLVVFTSDRDGDLDLYTKSLDGTGVATNLTNTADDEYDPSFSADGTRIAYTVGATAKRDIFSMASNGSNVVQITDGAEIDTNASWSPDGLRIAYQSQSGGINWDIYETDATQLGAPVQLTLNQGLNTDPDWSPDGLRIAFTSNRSGQSEVWVMDADGTNQAQLTTNGGLEPSWSPDGLQIAFTRTRSAGQIGDLEIFVMNADGTFVRPISNDDLMDGQPDWAR